MKNKIKFVIYLLFGLMFINAGLNKFLMYMPMPEGMGDLLAPFIEISWLMPLIAFVEIIGGILFILPKTRALGSLMIFPIIIGISLFHLITEPSGLPMAIILLAINVWAMIDNKEKIGPLLKF